MELSTITMLAFQLGLPDYHFDVCNDYCAVLIHPLYNHCQLHPQYWYKFKIFREKHADYDIPRLPTLLQTPLLWYYYTVITRWNASKQVQNWNTILQSTCSLEKSHILWDCGNPYLKQSFFQTKTCFAQGIPWSACQMDFVTQRNAGVFY